MAVNWQGVVQDNREKIILAAAATCDPEIVCVLFDIDLAREGKEARGVSARLLHFWSHS